MNPSIYQGRPLYFLVGILLCWTAARSGILAWSIPPKDVKIITAARPNKDPGEFDIVGLSLPTDADAASLRPAPAATFTVILKMPFNAVPSAVKSPAADSQRRSSEPAQVPPLFFAVPVADGEQSADRPKRAMPGSAPQQVGQLNIAPSRGKAGSWIFNGWTLWRHGSAGSRDTSGTAMPLYGASQIGARLAYRFDSVKPIEVYARASAPFNLKDGKEIAIGGAILPFDGANIAVAVEQRFRLDGERRSAPAVLVHGGFGPKALGSIEAEGYAQAGMVGLRDPNLFADGAMAVRKRIARSGNTTVHVGAGVWGGAQRGASRLDIGPRLGIDAPIKDGPNLRLALDWRQRIAGSAHPASGPAVSLGTDF